VQKSAALLSVVAGEMKTVATTAGLEVYEYSPSAVRKFLCDSGKATKRDVARIVAHNYPELSRYLKVRSKWEEKYYSNIFDAIAVGLRCRIDIVNQQLPFNLNTSGNE
jgi:Holliday junction resolvasome RuvABC endonuclease subunit